MKLNSAQLTSRIKKWCFNPFSWNSTKTFCKIHAKVVQNAKTQKFSRNCGQNDQHGPEIFQAIKSQSSCNLTDFSAAPKRLLIVVDVYGWYYMVRIVVNLLDNEFASLKFQVPFLKTKEGIL